MKIYYFLFLRSELSRHTYNILGLFILFCATSIVIADDARPDFTGTWVINEELSDDTDKQVEIAIKAAGGKVKRWGKKEKGRYKGGPKEQELYDHVSYDEVLQINYTEPEFRFVYAEGFERIFYSDGRGRVVSAKDLRSGVRKDFAFANWNGLKLSVEAKPRDNGFIIETYSLESGDKQLRVTLHLKPSSFGAPIDIVRIYDRSKEQ